MSELSHTKMMDSNVRSVPLGLLAPVSDRALITVGLLLVMAALAPFILGSYASFVVALVLINSIATIGVNISMGYAGLVSVGQAGFAGIGAYTTTLLMQHLNVNYFLALPAGAFTAAAFGLVIAVPALRLSSLYIAMVTFGFGQAVNLVLLNWVEVTRGPNGMAVPLISLGGVDLSPLGMHLFLVVTFACCMWIAWNLLSSRLGRALLTIRGNETVAESMGIPVARYKSAAFGLGAFYGGLAGGLYAGVAEFINPDAFTFGASINYLTMCVAGGLGTFAGPIVGAAVLTVLPELLRSVAEYKEFTFGVILLGVLVIMPEGIVPIVVRRFAAFAKPARKPGP